MSTALVLDTNIVSYLFKRTKEAALYLPHIAGKAQLISFQTVAELDYGIHKANWGINRIEQLEAYLTRFTVVPHTRSLSQSWAEAKNLAQLNGRRIEAADAWVAAAALEYGVPLVTHNPKDFLGVTSLQVITEV